MKDHKWNVADTITSVRIAASFLLLFVTPKSLGFFAVYTIAGLTDVLDGWLARKKGMASDFGAKLDSIADLLFYGIMLIRLFPILYQMLPKEIWCVVAGIVLIRIISYGTAAIKYHRLASLHTWLNKLTGVVVFLLPYMIALPIAVVYSWAVCALAFVSSMEELFIHLCHTSYHADKKSIFQ